MVSKSKCFLLVSFIFLAANFVWLVYFDNQENNPDFIFNKFYTFKAKVVGLDKKIQGWNIILEPYNLENYQGKVLVYLPLYPEYKYGEILQISCKVYQPEPIEEETGKIFLYDKYLAKDNIYGVCFRPKINIIGEEKNFSYYIFKVRYYFWNNLNIYLREPASSLSKAMLLADRREIPQMSRDSFAKLGLSHIIAISGLHMAIIVWLINSFLLSLGLSRKKSFLF